VWLKGWPPKRSWLLGRTHAYLSSSTFCLPSSLSDSAVGSVLPVGLKSRARASSTRGPTERATACHIMRRGADAAVCQQWSVQQVASGCACHFRSIASTWVPEIAMLETFAELSVIWTKSETDGIF
jgi:hypothetical protein